MKVPRLFGYLWLQRVLKSGHCNPWSYPRLVARRSQYYNRPHYPRKYDNCLLEQLNLTFHHSLRWYIRLRRKRVEIHRANRKECHLPPKINFLNFCTKKRIFKWWMQLFLDLPFFHVCSKIFLLLACNWAHICVVLSSMESSHTISVRMEPSWTFDIVQVGNLWCLGDILGCCSWSTFWKVQYNHHLGTLEIPLGLLLHKFLNSLGRNSNRPIFQNSHPYRYYTRKRVHLCTKNILVFQNC